MGWKANIALIVFSFETSLFGIENSLLNVTSVNSTLNNKVDITLNEEMPIGNTVGICQATDEDNLGGLTFQLDPQNVYFAIDKGSWESHSKLYLLHVSIYLY